MSITVIVTAPDYRDETEHGSVEAAVEYAQPYAKSACFCTVLRLNVFRVDNVSKKIAPLQPTRLMREEGA